MALDFLSNVTGVDWLDREIEETLPVTRTVDQLVDGAEQTVEEMVEETVNASSRGFRRQSIT